MHIIIDFDYTIFDTQCMRGKLATAMGVSVQQFAKAEQELKDRGELYSPQAHVEVLGVPMDLFTSGMQSVAECVYSDVPVFLQKHASAKITILTFGNVAWQEQKMSAAGIVGVDNSIATDGDKAELARQWVGEDAIVIVNDRGSEIDALAKVLPHARYVWVRREGTPYVDEPCEIDTIQVTHLSTIQL